MVATTWNPADHNASFVLSGGNLTATDTTSGSGWVNGRATDSKSSGKWYYEVTVVANSSTFGLNGAVAVGFAASGFNLATAPGTSGNSLAYFPWSGLYDIGGSSGTIQTDTTNGHVMQIAVDFGATLVWWKINTSTWNNSGGADPATGVGGKSFSALTGPWFPIAGELQSGTLTANFGDSAFAFTAPSGFTKWSAGGTTTTKSFFLKSSILTPARLLTGLAMIKASHMVATNPRPSRRELLTLRGKR